MRRNPPQPHPITTANCELGIKTMRYIALPGASSANDTRLSVLGFGCAALLGRASRNDSIKALNAAFDSGITFFDTARSYGYGASEGLLGKFLHGRRDKVILCTKFGILPVARNWKQMVKPVARAAVRLVPSLRQAAQRQASNQFNANQFSLSTLQSSLETSLRQLRTDYVDMLLMHEPSASVLEQQDLLEALAALVTQGKVRMAGVSADPTVVEQAFAQHPAALTTAQFPLNLSNIAFTTQTAQQKNFFLVANHPFGGPTGVAGTRERIAQLAVSPQISAEIRAKLTLDDPQLLPEVVFNTILSDTGIAAVIPAMMQPAHIEANVLAIENCRFTPVELAEIRTALMA
jgi:aryl-alcohol dehydrogenase-like predicted oxidoreductase